MPVKREIGCVEQYIMVGSKMPKHMLSRSFVYLFGAKVLQRGSGPEMSSTRAVPNGPGRELVPRRTTCCRHWKLIRESRSD